MLQVDKLSSLYYQHGMKQNDIRYSIRDRETGLFFAGFETRLGFETTIPIMRDYRFKKFKSIDALESFLTIFTGVDGEYQRIPLTWEAVPIQVGYHNHDYQQAGPALDIQKRFDYVYRRTAVKRRYGKIVNYLFERHKDDYEYIMVFDLGKSVPWALAQNTLREAVLSIGDFPNSQYAMRVAFACREEDIPLIMLCDHKNVGADVFSMEEIKKVERDGD